MHQSNKYFTTNQQVSFLSLYQTLYRCVLEDLYEFPTLEKDLKEFQKLLRRRQ